MYASHDMTTDRTDATDLSFPRKRESSRDAYRLRKHWIPACAGMTWAFLIVLSVLSVPSVVNRFDVHIATA